MGVTGVTGPVMVALFALPKVEPVLVEVGGGRCSREVLAEIKPMSMGWLVEQKRRLMGEEERHAA